METTTSPTWREPRVWMETGLLLHLALPLAAGQRVPGDGHRLAYRHAAEFGLVHVDAHAQAIHAADVGDQVARVDVRALADLARRRSTPAMGARTVESCGAAAGQVERAFRVAEARPGGGHVRRGRPASRGAFRGRRFRVRAVAPFRARHRPPAAWRRASRSGARERRGSSAPAARSKRARARLFSISVNSAGLPPASSGGDVGARFGDLGVRGVDIGLKRGVADGGEDRACGHGLRRPRRRCG